MSDRGLMVAIGLGLCFYLLCVFLLHALVFTGIQRDELEILGETQAWRWAYDPEHPPLVAWIYMALIELLGPSKWATAVYKTATLATLAALCALTIAQVTADRLAIAAAAFAPFATVAIGIQSLYNLTHSMLLIAALAGLVAAVARLARNDAPKWHHFLLAGCAIGVGICAKHLFSITVAALAVGVLADPVARARLGQWKVLWMLPPVLAGGLAVWAGLADSLSGVVAVVPSVPEAQEIEWLSWTGDALLFLVVKPIALAAPLVVVAAALAGRRLRSAVTGGGSGVGSGIGIGSGVGDLARLRRILFRAMAASVAIWAGVLVAHPELPMRPHYQIALTLLATLWASLSLAEVAGARLRGLAVLFLLCSFVGAAAVAARATLMPCDRCLQQLPVAEVARQIEAAGFVPGTIVSDGADWGTNLRTAFPESRLLIRAHPHVRPGPAAKDRAGSCLIVLHHQWPEETDDELIAFAAARTGAALDRVPAVSVARAPMVYGGREDVALQYILLPQGSGDCR